MNAIPPSQSNPSPIQPRPRRRLRGYGWGLILIGVGILLVLQNFDLLGKHFNGWALLILIPAIGFFATAWSAFERAERLNAAVCNSLGGGLIILTIAVMFLFNLNWVIWWPLMLLVPGFSIFLGGLQDTETGIGINLANLALWVGAATMLLGAALLVQNLSILNLDLLFGKFRWYGILVLIPGFGAFLNALLLTKSNQKFSASAKVLIGLGILICLVGALILAGLTWKLLAPAIIVAVGLGFLISFIFRK